MIHFDENVELQTRYILVKDIIEWSEEKLREMFDYSFNIFCKANIGRNYLSYDVDETTMTDEQWRAFSSKFKATSGYCESNFKKLLSFIFGEADYLIYINDLNGIYVIRHKKSNK